MVDLLDVKSFAHSLRDRGQWLCSCLFLFCVMVGLIIVILLHLQVFPDVQDTRCKCVCPHDHHATSNRTVFVKIIDSSPQWYVVPSSDDSLCSRCICTFETRNNFLVKFIIVSMMLLVLLMMVATLVYCIVKIRRNLFNSPRREYERIPNTDEESISGGNIQDNHRMKRRNRRDHRQQQYT